MRIELTTILKAISFLDKKTFFAELDDYIVIENGKLILQDINKTFISSHGELSEHGCFLIPKAEVVKLKGKGRKLYLTAVNKDSVTILVETKESKDSQVKESNIQLPITHRFLNLSDIFENEYKCNNCIELDGVKIKPLLKGYSNDIAFKFDTDGKAMISIEINDVKTYISQDEFDDYFVNMIDMNVVSNDSKEASVNGATFLKAINLLGLVKKNPTATLSFSDNILTLSNDNMSVYLYTNKLDKE